MVPGSTLMYGSSLHMVTRRPRHLSSRPRDDAVSPFPNEDDTPPVKKMNLVSLAVPPTRPWGPAEPASVTAPGQSSGRDSKGDAGDSKGASATDCSESSSGGPSMSGTCRG